MTIALNELSKISRRKFFTHILQRKNVKTFLFQHFLPKFSNDLLHININQYRLILLERVFHYRPIWVTQYGQYITIEEADNGLYKCYMRK